MKYFDNISRIILCHIIEQNILVRNGMYMTLRRRGKRLIVWSVTQSGIIWVYLVPVPNMFKPFTVVQPNGILGDFYFPSYLLCPSASPGNYGEGTCWA